MPFMSPVFSFADYVVHEYYGLQLLIHDKKLKHRHIVPNYTDVKNILGSRPFILALSGHNHIAQEGSIIGSETIFAQTSAISGADRFNYRGFEVQSGFTLYEVEEGKIVTRKFIPLKIH